MGNTSQITGPEAGTNVLLLLALSLIIHHRFSSSNLTSWNATEWSQLFQHLSIYKLYIWQHLSAPRQNQMTHRALPDVFNSPPLRFSSTAGYTLYPVSSNGTL